MLPYLHLFNGLKQWSPNYGPAREVILSGPLHVVHSVFVTKI